jgi:hypothetical protein
VGNTYWNPIIDNFRFLPSDSLKLQYPSQILICSLESTILRRSCVYFKYKISHKSVSYSCHRKTTSDLSLQKATIAKYKDRWDKVKDSMKKKKLAKAAAETKLAEERNRIDEEVEPE